MGSPIRPKERLPEELAIEDIPIGSPPAPFHSPRDNASSWGSLIPYSKQFTSSGTATLLSCNPSRKLLLYGWEITNSDTELVTVALKFANGLQFGVRTLMFDGGSSSMWTWPDPLRGRFSEDLQIVITNAGASPDVTVSLYYKEESERASVPA